MSALSHYLEDEGVATVAISLIRLHSEKVGNPRSLWVPFELGRPLGAPDAKFQTRVFNAALQLLEISPGPVILQDFPEEDPTAAELDRWRPPFELPNNGYDVANPVSLEHELRREALTLAPFYQRFVATNRRTTVGNSGMKIEECLSLIALFLTGFPYDNPNSSIPAVQMLRWAVDDVKAYYLEAASAGDGIPSSQQMQRWFWDQTLAAKSVIALRKLLLTSEDKRSQAIARINLVPGKQVMRLGLA